MVKFGRVSVIVGLVFPLLFLACSGGPKSTVEKMREKACNSDVDGFFSYVNKTEVEKNLRIQVMSEEEPYEGKKPGRQLGRRFAEALIQNLMTKIWQGIEYDLKKGENSTFCKLQIMKNDKKRNKKNEVKVKIENGESTWRFAKYNGKWLLIDLFGFEGQNPLVEKILPSSSPTVSATPSRTSVSTSYKGQCTPGYTMKYSTKNQKWECMKEK
jgi:hypothetical protein